MSQLHVITTHGKYVSTYPDGDHTGDHTGEETAKGVAEMLGATGARDFTVNADGIGWVALNPAYIVAVELREDGS